MKTLSLRAATVLVLALILTSNLAGGNCAVAQDHRLGTRCPSDRLDAGRSNHVPRGTRGGAAPCRAVRGTTRDLHRPAALYETSEREEKYTVRKPVYETSHRRETRTVRKPVYESSEREETRTVYDPVIEYQTSYTSDGWTTMKPVTSYQARVETRRVPVQTVRYVEEEQYREVPVRTVRYVEEQRVRKVPVRTVRYVRNSAYAP